MHKLLFISDHFKGKSYELLLEKTSVGRGEKNDLILCDSSVSHAHCHIIVNGPEVIVRDLGSRNGTYVNGLHLVNRQCQLLAGQIIKFGQVEARLHRIASDLTTSDDSSPKIIFKLAEEQNRRINKLKETSALAILGDDSGWVDPLVTVQSYNQPPLPTEQPAEKTSVRQVNPVKTAIINLFSRLFGHKY